MSEKSLFNKIENVVDEKSFIEFLMELHCDYDDNKSEWQNHDISTFFECAHEWAKISIDGLPQYQKSANPWRRCAEILYMGKIYE